MNDSNPVQDENIVKDIEDQLNQLVWGKNQKDQDSQSQQYECRENADCLNNPFETCSSKGICQHKDVFPILGLEFMGLFLLIVIMSLSTMAGIGGGGVVIPFCMTFFSFETKNAIALSGLTILSCSITRYIVSINERHPERNSVVIDYNLAAIMLPIVLVGSMIGVLVNVAFPSLYLQIMLTLVLLSLALHTAYKARFIYKQETEMLKVRQQQQKELQGKKVYHKESFQFMIEMQIGKGLKQKPVKNPFNYQPKFHGLKKSDSNQNLSKLENLQQTSPSKMIPPYRMNSITTLNNQNKYKKVQDDVLKDYLARYEHQDNFRKLQQMQKDLGSFEIEQDSEMFAHLTLLHQNSNVDSGSPKSGSSNSNSNRHKLITVGQQHQQNTSPNDIQQNATSISPRDKDQIRQQNIQLISKKQPSSDDTMPTPTIPQAFQLNQENDKEFQALNQILKIEQTHRQWNKQAVCFSCLVILLVVNLLRGSSKFKSIIGLQRCSTMDWAILMIFITFCSMLSAYSIFIAVREQKLKTKYSMGIASSDIQFNKPAIFKLVISAFIGGTVSGALGLGGGAIFNPILLSMGVPPKVASATGMYMIMFSTSGSSVIYVMYRMLNIQYGFWLGFWSSSGSILGMYLLNKVVKMYNRQSPVVFCLVFVLALSAVLVPIFGYIDLKARISEGVDITKFSTIC
eukprot:403365874